MSLAVSVAQVKMLKRVTVCWVMGLVLTGQGRLDLKIIAGNGSVLVLNSVGAGAGPMEGSDPMPPVPVII